MFFRIIYIDFIREEINGLVKTVQIKEINVICYNTIVKRTATEFEIT
jgi:hypothetical protein